MDSAGRLHNNVNLMESLAKIPRVMQKLIDDAPHESLLVVDGTTGQNILNQVKSFSEIIKPTGLIMTKLDSSAKGGTIPLIISETEMPLYFLGLGEKLEDLLAFDEEAFLDSLFQSE